MTNTYKQTICTYIRSSPFFNNIQNKLNNEYHIIKARHIQDSVNIIKSSPINIFVFELQQKWINDLQFVEFLKFNLANLKTIALVTEQDLELVRLCGKYGVDKVLLCSDEDSFMAELMDEVSDLLHLISLRDLNIEESSYLSSNIVAKACKVIENNYLTIRGVAEVANILDINESTLSREFKKQNFIMPKKLLMLFKVQHATKLIKKGELSIKEIAQVSGFTSSQHFNNCYKSIFGICPSSVKR